MKTILYFTLASWLVVTANAEFSAWTRNDGKSAELDLISVADADGEKSGSFKTRSGQTVTLKASSFAEADAKRLAEWKPSAPPIVAATSVFDDNLLILDRKSLKTLKNFEKPEKYYLFYYTASWCPPCHRFTPSLVEFYNTHKPGNREFEVVLITSDSDDSSMDKYAFQYKMPWPHLKLSKVEKFNKKFDHPGSGIPNLVLTDLQGKLLKTSYQGKTYFGPTVVMKHLEELLEK